MTKPILLLAALAVLAPLAHAQQMPDASQMAGVPLPAPELPDGTVTVRLVRERMGNNIAGHPVTLKTAQMTRTANTDAQGRAEFAGIEPGTVVSAEAVVDGEALRSQEFGVPVRGGVRVALVAGLDAAAKRDRASAEAAAKEPARAGIVVFGGESRVILEFQDDRLQVFYVLDVVNAARTPIDIGKPLVIDLPEGAIGAASMLGSSTQASVQGPRVIVNGPFPPGTTPVHVGYTMPHHSDSLSLRQTWPAVLERVFVAIEKVGTVQITSPQLNATREAQAGGVTYLMGAGDRLNAGDTLTLEITGLPYHTTTLRDLALGIALAMLAVGLWAAVTGSPVRRGHVAHLEARKEKLFAELVELERQRRQGRVPDGRYGTRRQTLVMQLERVFGELDRAPSGGGEGLAA